MINNILTRFRRKNNEQPKDPQTKDQQTEDQQTDDIYYKLPNKEFNDELFKSLRNFDTYKLEKGEKKKLVNL